MLFRSSIETAGAPPLVSENSHSHLRTAFQITCVALLIRLVIARLAFWEANPAVVLWPRGVEVLAIAKSLLTGSGFSSPFGAQTGPTAFMPPVYPAILAVVQSLFGLQTTASAWVIVCLQSLFSAATCVPVYFLAVRHFGIRAGRLAGWIWALLPYTAIIPSNIIWETCLSALVVSTGVLLIIRASDGSGTQPWILAGAFWALAVLTNASLLLLFPAYCVLTFVSTVCRTTQRRAVLLGLMAFALCLAPWLIRNIVVMHKFIPVRSNFALELWIGNRAGAEPGFHPEIHPAFNSAEVERYASVGELAYMGEKRDKAINYIRANPDVFVRNTVERIFRFWSGGLSGLVYGVTFLNVSGLAGLWVFARRHSKRAIIYGLPLLIYPLPFYVTHADLRYQHPIQPLLAVLAAFLLCRIAGGSRAYEKTS
jgi:4-amino-4-deoxy-L-arabinose transferase-like glycosyltransferase